MSDEIKSSKPSDYDVVLPIPVAYKDPVYSKRGELIIEGDTVRHAEFGEGKVLMIVSLDGQGPFLYIEFSEKKENRKMIDPLYADISKTNQAETI